jgi:hypothetical protein
LVGGRGDTGDGGVSSKGSAWSSPTLRWEVEGERGAGDMHEVTDEVDDGNLPAATRHGKR